MQPSDSPFTAPPAAIAPAPRLPLWRWIAEGMRAGFFLAPRTGGANPTPWQLLVLVLASQALFIGASYLEAQGTVVFNTQVWANTLSVSLPLLWVMWWAVHARPSPSPCGGLAAWFALSYWAVAPAGLLMLAYTAWAQAADEMTASPWLMAALAVGSLVWAMAASVRLVGRYTASGRHTAAAVLALVAAMAASVWLNPNGYWSTDDGTILLQTQSSAENPEAPQNNHAPPQIALTQEAFEAQQALWQRQLQALAAPREGAANVYGIVFAPYAGEEVFRRESAMVAQILQERFDAQARVLHLLNHPATAASHVWATPLNLQRALSALAQRMDRERDVLVLYMTSHGARNHQLAANHWPLQVEPVTPEQLRKWLDDAGIRHRVIVISACYSGGWIAPLESDYTLVMTAADARHTSYGCGTASELTYFGRAMFDEQLRHTHSFTQAFDKAVPLIRQREQQAGKDDGFSNPQISLGAAIAPVLDQLAQRLDNPPQMLSKK